MFLAKMSMDQFAQVSPAERRLAHQLLALAALVTLAVAIRLIGLTNKALWFDETVSVFLAAQPLDRLLALVGANEPHPPLYYLLLHAWIGTFGDSEEAVRMLSVLIGAPIVLAVWLFGRRLIGSWPAMFAAALAAVAPSLIASSQEARMYGLLTLTSVVCWWMLWLGTQQHYRWAWIGYAIVVGILLYTHYYGFFVVTSQAIYLLWGRMPEYVWRRWVMGVVGAMTLLMPWVPAFAQQLAGGRAWPGFRVPLTPALLIDSLAAMTVGRPILDPGGPRISTIQTAGSAGIAIAGFAAVLMAIAAALKSKKYTQDTRVLLVCSGVLPLALAFGVSLGLNVYAPRYMLFIVPSLALLVSAGCTALALGPTPLAKPLALLIAGMVALPNVMGSVAFYHQPRLDVFDWRTVSTALAADARREDAIVFLPGFSKIPVGYYFRGPQLRISLTPEGDDVEGPGGRRMPEIVAMLSSHPRVWILTVPPIPAAVETLIGALKANSFEVTRQEAINLARLILLERVRSP